MKKIMYIISVSLVVILTTNACNEDFLEKQPQGQFSPATMKTLEGVEGLLTGAYALLDGIGTNGVTDWHAPASNWIFGSVVSDDAYKGSDAGDQPEQTFMERYVWLPTNTHIYSKWRALYDGIARANDVLKTLAEVEEINEERRAQIEAEARFLRGHYHFEAKKMWNNISFISHDLWNPDDPSSVLMPNTEDVWPYIETDFEYAMDILPDNQSDLARPTRYSAMAYLAKTHMFQAFPNGQTDPAHIQSAKQLLDEIIASGEYRLVEQFHDNFAAETRNNDESIFEIQYSLTASDGSGGNLGDGLTYMYPNGPGGCCGFFQPSQNLVNAYKTDENGLPLIESFNEVDIKNDEGVFSSEPFEPYEGRLDSRLDWTVGRRGIPYLDWGVHPGRFWIRDQSYAGPYSSKKQIVSQAESGISGNDRLSANNYRLIRYSNVLLWAAECEVELGNLEQARAYVNIIRERAANPDGFVKNEDGTPAANYVVGLYTQPWSDQALAREAVRFETRLEFAMEGHRFFDLVRWGIAEPVLNEYLEKERQLRTYLSGATFENKHRFYPIPEQAIVYSSKNGEPTLKQNEGY
ncbi:RagB/SusD family nutrient uptake outer membrane protein [Catalinimonas niigatensis]|uniref:RagB/SusD family nutrient uptake outer membrane protein n=1 Tax=Catalinimonas niigatensis TaxID=1397264 RepID=UPI0026663000|nr:RagB/SusD family nutrient uptake outer membrane protein [Catalinimonas niigatensis]WPP51906.1 RagB/SusD family nutrient uptake outer membrane protein [Catalinimonas niigatensis]